MILNFGLKNLIVVFPAFCYAAAFGYFLVFLPDELGSFAETQSTRESKTLFLFSIAPFGCIWAGIHHLNKPKGIAKLSILAIFYLFIGLATSWIAIDLITDELSGWTLKNSALLGFGLIHLMLTYFCYQNEANFEFQSVSGSATKNLDLVRLNKLVKLVSSGQYNYLYSSEFDKDISDAAIQAVSEHQLNKIAKKLLFVKNHSVSDDNDILEAKYWELLQSCWDQLDEESKYQIYPLISCAPEHTRFYFEGDVLLHSQTLALFDKRTNNFSVEILRNEYFKNSKWAKQYPILIEALED